MRYYLYIELTNAKKIKQIKQQPNVSDNSKVPNTINNSVSITPAPPLSTQNQQHSNDLKVSKQKTLFSKLSESTLSNPMLLFCLLLLKNERLNSRDDVQTPAQRQAAAKLALRKQLEKTLLQVS